MGEGWWPSPREVPGQDTRHPPTLSSHQGAEGPESEEGRLAAAVLETGTLPSSPPPTVEREPGHQGQQWELPTACPPQRTTLPSSCPSTLLVPGPWGPPKQ